jgi:threonine/homoserine/homoserine lactone efflux protein
MPSGTSLFIFTGATLLLLAVPGPAVTYIVTRSIAQGRRAGLLSVAGIHLGTMVHVLAAVVGLSALVVQSATAFTIVKLAGAAYLIYLGIRTLARRAPALDADGSSQARSERKVFVDGFVVNVLNPKTAVFFLAFVPQFVDPARGSATLQILVLGAMFIVLGTVTDGAYAIGAAWVTRKLRHRSRRRQLGRRLSGSIYLGLGAATAVSGGASD